jgi:hypothetical protein
MSRFVLQGSSNFFPAEKSSEGSNQCGDVFFYTAREEEAEQLLRAGMEKLGSAKSRGWIVVEPDARPWRPQAEQQSDGASAINCWWARCNSPAWYSLRLSSRPSELLSIMSTNMKSLSCPDRRCSRSRKSTAGSIIRHGFYKTTWGKRRRFQCRICGKTSRRMPRPLFVSG